MLVLHRDLFSVFTSITFNKAILLRRSYNKKETTMPIDYESLSGGISPIKLLLTGSTGSGKTYKAAHFPNPLFFNFDRNLSCLQLLPSNIKDNVHSRNPYKKDGKKVEPVKVFDNFIDQLALAAADPAVQTIVIDSFTALCDTIYWKILGTDNPSKVMQRQDWGNFVRIADHLGLSLLCADDLDKHVVFIAHEQVDTDETTKKVTMQLAVSSKIKDTYGRFFSDIWRCFNRVPTAGPVQHMVRVAATNEFNYKCSLGLPQEFDFDKVQPELTKILSSRLALPIERITNNK